MAKKLTAWGALGACEFAGMPVTLETSVHAAGDGKPVRSTIRTTFDFGVDFPGQASFYRSIATGVFGGKGFWLGLLGAVNAGCTAEATYTDNFGVTDSECAAFHALTIMYCVFHASHFPYTFTYHTWRACIICQHTQVHKCCFPNANGAPGFVGCIRLVKSTWFRCCACTASHGTRIT